MDLTGVWLGNTIGAKSQTHHWIIVQNGEQLDIYTRWQDELRFHVHGIFKGTTRANNLFWIHSLNTSAYGEVLTDDSFKVHHWCYGWQDGKYLPIYGVLFERSTDGLQQFEVEFIMQLYEDKTVVKRFNKLPYA